MYLISLYFDEKSNRKLQLLINKAADKSGNKFMTDNNVPPHITIGSFESREVSRIIKVLDEKIKNAERGKIDFASIGAVKSSVIYIAPVLNKYLHNLSVKINEALTSEDNVLISKYYMPFQWIPHVTIAKKLTEEELMSVFQIVQKSFSVFKGEVVKIALSKTNPHEDIFIWELENSL